MTEAYVIGSIVLSLIVVAILYHGDPIDNPFKCPRCGSQMWIVGDELDGFVIRMHVVPAIPKLQCPQCGYTERSWAY